jgi:ATP synthase protein I
MDEKPSPPSLQELDARLKRLRAETEANTAWGRPQAANSGLGMAFTIASHLVAGLGVGGGIGYLLDRWLATAPWLLIAFFLLGAAAGGMNVYRTMRGYGMALGYRPAEGPETAGAKKGKTATNNEAGAETRQASRHE